MIVTNINDIAGFNIELRWKRQAARNLSSLSNYARKENIGEAIKNTKRTPGKPHPYQEILHLRCSYY